MIVYPDASLLVSAFTIEAGRRNAAAWLKRYELAISDWAITEFSSALAKKGRMNLIEVEYRLIALRDFAALVTTLDVLPVTRGHFRNAAAYMDGGRVNLRAGDALHLAIAAANGLTIATLDDGMTAATEKLGLACIHPDVSA